MILLPENRKCVSFVKLINPLFPEKKTVKKQKENSFVESVVSLTFAKLALNEAISHIPNV
jgi:hypothetical protein